MKKLIAAAIASGGLAVGLIAAGGASTALKPAGAATTPTITLSKPANLVGNEAEIMSGSGFADSTPGHPDELILAECNADGATGSDLDSCKIFTSLDASKTGTFKKEVQVLDGALVADYASLTQCPPDQTQAHIGVPCILAAANATTGQTSFAPIYFKTDTPKLIVANGKKVDGKPTYELKVRLLDAYTPVSSGSEVNYGGLAIIPTYTSGGTTTTGDCQPTTVTGTDWGILPVCNGSEPESVKVTIGKTTYGPYKARVDTGVAGDFSHTFKDVAKGDYKVTIVGEQSGEVATGKVKVG